MTRVVVSCPVEGCAWERTPLLNDDPRRATERAVRAWREHAVRMHLPPVEITTEEHDE